MTTATKTALATILRQLNQGLIDRATAYHLISDLYYQQLNSNPHSL